ncbi:MurR/RpiR family transcriptional regulator [Malacoplasma penetrans]|uniref:MurR/RpiR family transcriptional regulator n=1 Tax=Malacoplasma penetrans TaxID=28227 RepID=UPI001010BD1A|nr:MurR/RpiR family transcriptional regulator [Malacoplasma penetrans]RXY96974.1 MurR/RpiR family transcriptional regulator [Malacoplasma penetrans]
MTSKLTIFNIEKYQNLNEIEKDLLKKINENPIQFLDNNIIDISKSFYSSKSSISRLSQKIGFKHLSDMKLYISGKLAMQDLYNLDKEESNTKSRIRNLRTYNIFAINETLSNINISDIKNICANIIKSRKVICYGLGSSFLAAQELSQNMLKLGINSISINDIHNLLLALSSADKSDLLVLFSKSGTNKEISYSIKVCNELNIDVLLITCNKEVANRVKYKIIMEDIWKDKRLIATSSKTCMLAISDLLYYELYYMTETADRNLEKANNLLNGWKEFSKIK